MRRLAVGSAESKDQLMWNRRGIGSFLLFFVCFCVDGPGPWRMKGKNGRMEKDERNGDVMRSVFRIELKAQPLFFVFYAPKLLLTL